MAVYRRQTRACFHVQTALFRRMYPADAAAEENAAIIRVKYDVAQALAQQITANKQVRCVTVLAVLAILVPTLRLQSLTVRFDPAYSASRISSCRRSSGGCVSRWLPSAAVIPPRIASTTRRRSTHWPSYIRRVQSVFALVTGCQHAEF